MWGSGNLSGTSLLNFKVVGGLTQPDNPSKNTIWVNTDIPISEWSFSAVEPENSAEGMVWISTGTSSTVAFSATKKNTIMIYPLAAKQYIGGVWVDQTARSHQNGVWIDWWNGELYDSGNEFESITGGWALSRNYEGSHDDTVTKNESNMVLTSKSYGESNGHGFLRTNNKIDLTAINTLYLEATVSLYRYHNRCVFCASSVDSGNSINHKAEATVTLTDTTEWDVFALDVSELSGEYHVGVGFGMADDAGTSTVTIKKIRME